MITRQFQESTLDSAYVSLILALLVLIVAQTFNPAANSTLFHRHARRFLSDYGLAISVLAASACGYWGRFNASNPPTLPVGRPFEPSGGRDWLVPFWNLCDDPKWIALALPFGLVCAF
jgi:hypothetical protein